MLNPKHEYNNKDNKICTVTLVLIWCRMDSGTVEIILRYKHIITRDEVTKDPRKCVLQHFLADAGPALLQQRLYMVDGN